MRIHVFLLNGNEIQLRCLILLPVQGDLLRVKVNKLTSIKTQLPYSYYSLPYCRPKQIFDSAENLGEVLRGDRIENSPFEVCYEELSQSFFFLSFFVIYLTFKRNCHCFSQFKMREPEMCTILCRIVLDAKMAKDFKEKIDDEYRVNM